MSHPMSGLYIRVPADLLNGPSGEPLAPAPVPLLGVTVDAELTGASARVTLAQRFKNVEARPIEAVYLFPLPTDAAICAFAAEVDGRLIEGRVEERDKAFELYDDAMADGHGAFLMDQERPNVFTLSVGNLKPGSEAVIRISWVVSLAWEGEALRFQLPTTVSPRYAPGSNAVEIGQPDADKLNPERRFAVPYGLSLRLAVTDLLKRVESPTHPLRTTLGAPTLIELSQADVALDRDVVIIIEPAAARTPTAHVARDAAGNRYVQVGFLPDFERSEAGAEVVFVVDCSGSMGGDSIASARRALELCVRALDLRDRFDIVRFGSSFETLFGAARAFDDASLAAAVAFVQATDATLGGTEILAPLQALVQRPLAADGRMRQVLLLTDGQVSNESDVIELARANADKVRIFAFGIGAGVSEHLVREVARATRGEVEMIAPGERIEPKVLRQFGRVRSPALDDVRVDWGGLEVEQAPKVVPPVFEGELLTVWAKLRAGAASEVTLSAGARRWVVPLDLERAVSSGPVPALWGRSAIRDIEVADTRHGSSQQRPGKADRKNDKLVEIGKTLGLVSSATSYVAVELRADADRTTTPAELRRVPIALTAGWGGAVPQSVLARAGLRSRMSGAPSSPIVAGAPPSMAAAPPARRMASGPLHKRMARPYGEAFRAADPVSASPQFDAMPAEPSGAPGGAGLDPLYALLLTQAANGSFPAGPLLLAALRDVSAFKALVAIHGEAPVATAVVLALLARDHGDRQGEWKAAVDKAQRFLAGAPPIDAAAFSALI